MTDWKKQESNNNWSPEQGNILEGTITEIITDEKFGTQYKVKTENGEVTTPAHKVLQSRMKKAVVGTKVKIEYLGEELPKIKGNNPTKMYDVFFAEE